MAKDKKCVLLYCDLIHSVSKLTDEEAGKLFKHFLSYVNDLNPESDRLTELLFEPIKQTLKRDLRKWEVISSKRSEIGKLAGIKSGEARRSKAKQDEAIGSIMKQTEQDTDTVRVKDIVKVKDILLKKETKYNFRKNLIEYGFKEKLVDEWLEVRKKKKMVNSETAFKKFIQQVEKIEVCNLEEVLETCVEKSWGGFNADWLKNLNDKNNGKESTNDFLKQWVNQK